MPDRPANAPRTARDGPSARTGYFLGAVVVAILVNSLALAYGFRQVRRLSDAVVWVVAPAAAMRAASLPDSQKTGGTAAITVELFSDFACEFCRSSVSAVDSARRLFEGRVEWRYRYLASPPVGNALSFDLARLGVCTEAEGGPWRLFSALSDTLVWSEKAARDIVVRWRAESPAIRDCIDSDSSSERVWRDVFAASALGIRETPTIYVGRTRVAGRVTLEPLVNLINYHVERLAVPGAK